MYFQYWNIFKIITERNKDFFIHRPALKKYYLNVIQKTSNHQLMVTV